jgi:dihydrofolate synthase/folylpolyglutamate synthase
VAILTALRDRGTPISDQALRAGLANARWPGRFELLHQRPALIVDCAHNDDSALRLQETLARFYPPAPGRRWALVFGASVDKDIPAMLRILLATQPAAGYLPPARVIVTRSGHPRQSHPAQLATLVREIAPACPVVAADSLDVALTDALAWATPDDVICVTGSIFVVAQARRAWAADHPGAFPPDDWAFQDETPGQSVPDDETASEAS